MRNGRRDANHRAIVTALRQLPGVTVADTADMGGGFPDIVVGIRGQNIMIEIKDGSKPPSKRKLTSAELAFHRDWTGQIAVVNSLDEALELVRLAVES